MSKYSIQLFLILFITAGSIKAQPPQHPIYGVTQNNPKLPQASSLFKYQNFPVNMATGIANISIPIYEITDGNIHIPISINYSTGGIKVNQTPTNLGIGWSLNCGGSIYQKVNGLDDIGGNEGDIPTGGNYFNPDLQNINPIQSTVIHNLPEFHTFYNNTGSDANKIWEAKRFIGRIADGWIDAEADEFALSSPTGSNTIFYDQTTQSYKTAKIEGWNIIDGPKSGNVWEVKDRNGLFYHFNFTNQYRNPLNYNPHSIPSGNPMNPGEGIAIKNQYLTDTWFLGSVDDTKTGRTVGFTYSKSTTTIPSLDQGSSSYMMTYPVQNNGIKPSILNFYEREETEISEITFSDGKVQFVYYTDIANQFGPRLLKYIKVLDKADQVVKTIKFEYAQVAVTGANGVIESQNPCNFLSAIKEETPGGGTTVSNTLYSFAYNLDAGFPKRFSYAQDKWGFYNGSNQNTTFFPMDVLQDIYAPNASSVGSDRLIHSTYTKAGTLKELVYPTKGKALFTYEQNHDATTEFGGLRVSEIAYQALSGAPDIVSKYQYDNNNVLVVIPKFLRVYYKYQFSIAPQIFDVTGSSLLPLNFGGSNGVYYTKVDNLYEDLGANEKLKSSHYFSVPGDLPSVNDDNSAFSFPRVSNLLDIGPQEVLTENFKYNKATNNFELIESSSTSFQNIKGLTDFIPNIQAIWSQQNAYPLAFNFVGNDPYNVQAYPTMNMLPVENRYNLYSDNYLPDSKSKTVISNTTMTNAEQYEYDQQTGNVKLYRVTGSNGDVSEIRYKYSNNYTTYSNTQNPWDVMLSETTSSLPIEITVYKKKYGESVFKVTKSNLYSYSNNNLKEVYEFNTDQPVSDFVSSTNTNTQFTYDARYDKKFETLVFDNNYNPLLVKDNKVLVSYLYDYSNNYAIARVVNAANTDMAATSFESTGKGNWNYSGTPASDATAPTGKMAYSLGGGAVTKTGLNSTVTYIVSYWSKNGAQTASNSISNTQGRTVSGWTYFEHKVTGSATITVSGAGTIDELRLYPQNAEMVTFTYNPLIGITSQCDMQNRISYYQYDSYNRLTLILDQDKNIQKKICYSYAGQPEDCSCPPNSQPTWQNTGNFRCQVNGSNQYTGYTEYEQVNTNPCNTATTQWVVQGGSNTAVCPTPGNGVNLTSTNTNGATGWVASYYNTVTGYTYNLNVSTATTLQALGNIPAGTYNLTIYRPAGGFASIFKSGCNRFTVSGTSVTFYNISVSSTTCNSITIMPDMQN